jgi:hypothetical protein
MLHRKRSQVAVVDQAGQVRTNRNVLYASPTPGSADTCLPSDANCQRNLHELRLLAGRVLHVD